MSITNYPDADFTPDIPNSGANTGKQSYNPTGSFRFWAQKVLPTVYDDSLSYYEILTKVVNYLNAVIQNVDSLNESVDNTNSAFDTLQRYVNGTKDTIVSAYNELQSYVNTYFDSLDVQEEINAKLDGMASDGSLSKVVSPFIPSLVSDWLSHNITPTSPAIDASLSISGAGADAKVTGEFKSAFEYTADVLKTGRKIINQVQIESSGVIVTNQYHLYDVWCFQVVPGDVISNITISSGTYVYAFYADEPDVDSVSYNNSREVGSTASVDNVVVPAGCNWIAVRTPVNETVTINPVSTVLSKINGKIDEQFDNELEQSISEAGWTVYDYPFIIGHKYTLTNTGTTNNIIARSRAADGTTNVETISGGLLPGASVEFVPTVAAPKLSVYANGATTFKIQCDYTIKALSAYDETLNAIIQNVSTKALTSERTLVSVDSISAHPECANLDDLKINSVYTYTGSSLAGVSGNLPFPKGFTIVTNNSLTDTYAGCYQCAFNLTNSALAFRINAGSWSDWFYTNNVSFVVGTNGDFTTLKECTEFIMTNHVKNAKVLIKEATYDLVTEYTSTALDSITDEAACGLIVGNNTHFIFEQNAKVVFNYTGSNAIVGEYFSPFNVAGDVTFENMIVECSNCRYCVHEDIPTIAQNVPNASTIRYINCNMKNSGGAIAYEAPVCIGAGTNKNTASIIDGGVYNSSWTYDIAYHNYNGTTRGKVILKNVWMKNGLRLSVFSTSPIDVLVSGCRMAKAILNADSFDVKAWNNVIEN